jgi:rhomboid protease GluP
MMYRGGVTHSRAVVAPVLLAVNVAVYILVGAGGAGWMEASGKALIGWGSNFGPLTADGQWWRLITAMFLHGGLVHLAVNMITLADLGSFCERAYGRTRFALLYFLSGVLGSAASVWWNPSVNSVGASGALFGVIGAMLVFMLDKRNGVPPGEMKAHVASLGIFIVYGLVNGFASKGIDNAAHLGGLAGGLLLGWALMPSRSGAAREMAGLAVLAVAVGALAWNTPNTRAAYEAENRFMQDIEWLKVEEDRLNGETRRLFARAREPGATDAELRPGAMKLSTEWGAAHARFSAYKVDPPSKFHELHLSMLTFLDLRKRAMDELVRATESPRNSKAHMEQYARLMKEANAAVEKMKPGGAKKGAKKEPS